jgi:hypothetical protein
LIRGEAANPFRHSPPLIAAARGTKLNRPLSKLESTAGSAMKFIRWFLISFTLWGHSCWDSLPEGVRWDSKTGHFEWWSGEVWLPPDFTYRTLPTDTFEGEFTSPDKTLVVQHDIGFYAGAWAKDPRAYSFEERIVEGSRVWIGRHSWGRGNSTLVAVTFPDSGCANFFVESGTREGAEVIHRIANGFRPKFVTMEGDSLCR